MEPHTLQLQWAAGHAQAEGLRAAESKCCLLRAGVCRASTWRCSATWGSWERTVRASWPDAQRWGTHCMLLEACMPI